MYRFPKGSEVVTVNYNISSTTFLEGTYGRAGNQLAAGGLSINDVSNSRTTGLANLPLVFPDAHVITPTTTPSRSEPPEPAVLGRDADLQGAGVPVGEPRHLRSTERHLPGFLNINTTQESALNITQVRGRHTLKAGFYNNHSLKRENNVLEARTSGRSTSRRTPWA